MKKRISNFVLPAVALGAGMLTTLAISNGSTSALDCSAVSDATELTNCFSAGGNITLSSDITLPYFNVLVGEGKSVKLDLAGHNIAADSGLTPAIWIKQGHLEIIGNGTISSSANDYPAILVSGSTEKTASGYSSLTVGKNIKLINNNFAALSVDKYATESAFHGIKIDFNGEAIGKYGIQIGKNADTFENANLPVINIHDGAKITAETDIETDAPGQAIRAEGRATWNINKATITGDTGIALRAGKFYLNGPTVTATGPDEAYIHYFSNTKGAGDTTCDPDTSCEALPGSGAAIQIQEAQTEAEDGINDIEIFINGGTFESKYGYAISEYKERVEHSNPTILTDTLKTLTVTEGNLMAFTNIDEERKAILKNETRYILYMVTDDFSWRFGDGRMCADNSATVKSYDTDWLRTHFEVHPFAKIDGLDEIYAGLPWIERLLVDYVHFPGPYDQYNLTDAENVALDIYAESKGIKYEDIKFTDLFDLVLYRFEKDYDEEPEYAPFGGTISGPADTLTSGTSKPYTIIRDTESYPLTFTMKLPENLPAVEEGYTRNYSVLDLHCLSGGTKEEEEACEVFELPVTLSEDGTEYTFTTTKFSVFIFTYNDKKTPAPEPTPEEDPSFTVPDTGYLTEERATNNSVLPTSIIVSAFVLTSSILLIGLKSYKRHLNNKR